MVEPGAPELDVVEPSVSVIVPAYNAAADLARSVASAQAQSLRDIEIIIVDDASGDETLGVAQRLAAGDPRVKVIAAASNGGPSAARNRGLAAARGRWIALLDADDAFVPQRLARLLEVAEREGADMVADNLLLEPKGGPALPMLPVVDAPERSVVTGADFLNGNLPDPAQPRRSYGFLKPLISRAFLTSNGLRYDETLRFAEDFALYLNCFVAGAHFLLLREPLYRYTIRADSLTAQHTAADLRRFQALHERLLERADDFAPDFAAALKRHKRAVDQRLQWRVVMQALKAGTWGQALVASLQGWHVFYYVVAKLLAEVWRRLTSGLASAKAAET